MTSKTVPQWLFPLLATACGIIVANLYYAQPLAGPISAALGMTPQATGLIVTLTQIGYVIGLIFIVPIGDLIENRRLIVTTIAICVLALLSLAVAQTPSVFLLAAFGVGITSVTVQIIVPYAAHLAPEEERGRIVGNVMSGLLLGIMLARPVSSFFADYAGWRTVFVLSAVVVAALGLLLWRALPLRQPEHRSSYAALIGSLGKLLVHTPTLQRRAAYQFFQFCAFSLFWTVAPLLLASPAFGLSQSGIALFALAGVAGAISAPIAGRLADRGLGKIATFAGFVCVLVAYLMTRLLDSGTVALGLLVFAGILLDFGVTMSMVSGQRIIYNLGGHIRARLNALYMAIFFVGGALGSSLGAWLYAHGGWHWASSMGMALPVLALLVLATERREKV